MSTARYDLTSKVAAFLDPALLKKVEEFNGVAPSPAPTSAPAPSEPTLENAQKLYDAGSYLDAYKMLSSLSVTPGSDDEESLVWGKFAAAILAFPDAPKVETKPDAAAEEIKEETADETKDEEDEEEATEAESTPAPAEPEPTGGQPDPVMDALVQVQVLLDQRRGSDSIVQLNRRAWFIHWSLFAYFNGRLPKLVDVIFSSQNMSVIQAACPWVLRYVAIAVIATHSRTARFDRRIKDMTRVVQQELYEYSDPVLDFVQALYIDYDFATLPEKLNTAIETISQDFFAHTLVDKITDALRVLIADTVLRVHEFLPVKSLQHILGLKDDTKWIAEYITSKQEAKLDAAYDTEKGIVRVNYSKPSINSQVSDKVKAMDHKAHLLQQTYKKTEA